MTQPNRMLIALSGIAAGASAGAALATICTMIANKLVMSGTMFLGGDPTNLVFLGIGLDVVLAVLVGWRTSLGVDETWRRGVVSALAAFAAVPLGFGSAGVNTFSMMLSNELLSTAMMPAYLVILVTVTVLAMRLAKKSRGATPAP